MTVHKLTAGDGYTYLTRQVAAHDATSRGFASLGDYYAERGESPGVWLGRGLNALDLGPGEQVGEAQMLALFGQGRHPNADRIEAALLAAGVHPSRVAAATRLGSPYPVFDGAGMFSRRSAGQLRDYNTAHGLAPTTPVPAEVRARLRTDLARTMFAETYGRPAADARELAGHLARLSRQATTAVAGYDLTFSPVKSVSVLWAIAPREVGEVIEAAHRDAVADTLTWLEDTATFTRTGPAGVAQVNVRGLIAGAFTHRDSRAGDPDLHTHVAISNKVQTYDGRWLALDGRLLYRNNVAASERYNTRLEALLVDRLGVRFADRPDGDPGKRPVREIVGIDGALPKAWSSRRAAIDLRRAALAAEFQTGHGRPPTPVEALHLAQRANLETRPGKHEPRSHAEQRVTWRAEALTIFGDEDRLADYVHRALHPEVRHERAAQRVTPAWIAEVADRVVTVLESDRAVWQVHHVRAEAERQTRAAAIPHAHVDQAVSTVVDAVLGPSRSVRLDTREPLVGPGVLRRADGSSVYTVAGSTLYTSPRILAAERAILHTASEGGGWAPPTAAVEVALLESAANGVELNPGQVHLVRELAASGRRVQLALAPAGTGKTTALRALTRAWTDGGGDMLGLAPSAAAAAVLQAETGQQSETLAKLLHHLQPTSESSPPEWLNRVGPRTLVLVDEAGMAATTDLAQTIAFALGRGASVRLVGDDQQLAAVGAGGVLRDLAHRHGALTLSQVLRFTHPDGAPNRAEAAASLALRAGDPTGLGHYLDHHRVHVGDLTTATESCYAAWAADRADGRDALMLAPTRELVTHLNQRARTDRLDHLRLVTPQAGARHPDRSPAREVSLADGLAGSAGDLVITRRNDRSTPITATDWVKNGDRWTIRTVNPTGSLTAIHARTGRRVTLPADYVSQHVQLGYAATVHTAQGVTADTCHLLATGQETRQLLYVGMTRGRHANHVHLATPGDGNPHELITRDALLPPTAVDLLTRILDRDGTPISASSLTDALAHPVARLRQAVLEYRHDHATAAETVLGPERLAALDAVAEARHPGLTDAPSYLVLRGHLALLTLAGADPGQLLSDAIAQREIGTATDVAAVLDWRLPPPPPGAGAGPLPWLPATPRALTTDSEWASYLDTKSTTVTIAMEQVRDLARSWQPDTAPGWAVGLLDRDPDRNENLVVEVAVWRAAAGVLDSDRRPTGPPALTRAEAQAQRALDRHVEEILGDPGTATARWRHFAAGVEPRIAADLFWPELAGRLSTAERAGIDIGGLLQTAAAAGPLPDELPAAALWWRIAGQLSPATLTTHGSGSVAVRPDWTPALFKILGDELAERLLLNPEWPGLVAAVTHARAQWAPAEVLRTAWELLRSGQPEGEPLRPDEVTTALSWRIELLTTDTHPSTERTTQAGQARADATADPVGPADSCGPLDDAWLAGLTEPHDPQTGEWPADPTSPDADADPDLITAAHRTLAAQDRAVEAAHRAEEQRWRDAPASRDRILDLNQLAAAFYTARYPGSWAPGYLQARLGTDLTGDTRFPVGYAPHSWTALTTHLRATAGATDAEILAAGLGARAITGQVIDRFRDRLVFPITATAADGTAEIHGFIGRRNPADPAAGPKYLNTPETLLFRKGALLYGHTNNRAALHAGATPVLAEGPLDAIAITLAGQGEFAGVAPLGTAFTDTQALLLHPHLRNGTGPVVATDADPTGDRAAERIFWLLTDHNTAPRRLDLNGTGANDPAELLQTSEPDALHRHLHDAAPLADSLITARLSESGGQLHTIEGRVHATRRAAPVIAAESPTEWPRHLQHLTARTGISPGVAMDEILTANDRRARRLDSHTAHANSDVGAGEPSAAPNRQPHHAPPKDGDGGYKPALTPAADAPPHAITPASHPPLAPARGPRR